MTRAEAETAIDAIFEDLRDRKFLKWLFCEDPESAGPILHMRDGLPLMPLDGEVQAEIREAWITILLRATRTEGER